MANATFNQVSFLGGEWSPAYQGRIDDPHYKIAMNRCVNGYPVEEGAWTRRSGFRRIAPTKSSHNARLWAFNYSVDFPFLVELSAGFLRIYAGDAPLLDSTAGLVSSSDGPPMTIVVDGGGTNWATDDTVVLIPSAGWENSFGSLPNQQFTLTALGGGAFTLADSVTGSGIDGSQVIYTAGQPQATIGHIYRASTPWTGTDWYDVTTQIFGNDMFFFHKNYVPWELSLANLNTTDPAASAFTFAAAFFHDGPYLEPGSGQTATVSGISGSITVTLINGFGPKQNVPTSADIGRQMRLWNEPLAWDSGTSYAFGSSVKYGDIYYSANKNGTTAGQAPNITPQEWYPNPTAAAWVWGIIEAVLNDTQVTLGLEYNLLYATTIAIWKLGAIGDPGNNPTCGCGHENRLWMFAKTNVYSSQSGPINPVDATPPDQLFSTTLIDGTVVDANAISYELQTSDEDANYIQWAITGPTGMILGTPAGEWVVKASQLDDPLTPTSIQARRVTRYKTYKAKPTSTPLATVFVQKYQRKVQEFLPDVFTGRYVAPNLTATAKHLTVSGVEELAYVEEITPIIWARRLDETLIGATYRRTSAFVSEAPAFTGWHQHIHGQERHFRSLQASPTPDGTLDCIYVVTDTDGAGTRSQVERLVKQFDEGDSVYSSWFLDNANTPSAVIDQGTGVVMWGFYDKAGLSVEVFIGGLDLGAFTVGSLGQITVPYTSTFTSTYLQSLAGEDFGEAASTVKFSVSTTPTRLPTPSVIGNFLGSNDDASASFNANTVTAVDFGRNQFYTVAGTIGGATSFQIHSYDMTTRAAGTSVAADTLGFTDEDQAFCFAVAPDGNLLITMDNTDTQRLYKVDPATMTELSHLGTSGNTGSPNGSVSDPGHIDAAVTVGCTGGNFLVAVCGTPTLTANIYVADVDAMAYAYGPDDGVAWNSKLCRGQTGASGSVLVLDNDGSHTFTLKQVTINASATGIAATVGAFDAWSNVITYITGDHVLRAGIGYTSIVDGNVGNDPTGDVGHWVPYHSPHLALSSIGTIAPADIDPTWTLTKIGATDVDFCYDQSDGNALAVVSTADAVTHTSYLIKINTANAAVLWAIPLSMTTLIPGLLNSRVINGQLALITDSGTVYSINTLAGTVTTTLTPAGIGANAVESYFYDAVIGVLYAAYNYNSGTGGAPTQLSGTPSTFHEYGVWTPGTSLIGNTYTVTSYSIPAIAGFPFNSQGQVLRPATPQETGAQNGPALGKKRRNSKYSMLLTNAQSFTVGTDFTNQFSVPLNQANGTPYAITALFDGVVRDTLSDDYSFDGMLAWATGTSCYPLTVVSVGGFVQTQDD